MDTCAKLADVVVPEASAPDPTCPECGLRGMTDDEIEDVAQGGRTPGDVCPGDHYAAEEN